MFVGITNTPRDYAWGSTGEISALLGLEESHRTEAELWLGAHAGSPSRVVGEDATLLDVVDGRLPFLLKVLAAGSPLSLQAHPTMAQAQEGFARENALGIPLDAAERNYKDAFHKPELIYALSDEFEPQGVQVSAVLPTFTNTELIAGTDSTGAQKPVEPEDIAAAVVRIIEKPRVQVTVPKPLGAVTTIVNSLPTKVRRFMSKKTGTDRVFLDIDTNARSAYENRAGSSLGVTKPDGE